MAPGADTVGLVDDKQRRFGRLDARQGIFIGELLRCQKQELDRALLQGSQNLFASSLAKRRVEHGSAADILYFDRACLVAL